MRTTGATIVLVMTAALAWPQPSDEPERLRVACEAGSAPACYDLGIMNATGAGVPRDDAKAAELYRKGCDGGDARGCTNLGFAYDNGQGVAQDKAKAARLYQKACDGGHALGCTNLGYDYDKGEGVAQDQPRAAQLYQKACDGGNALGCTNLGVNYEKGRGVAQDKAKAVQLYERACKGGNTQGCTNLGILYTNGPSPAPTPGHSAALPTPAPVRASAVKAAPVASSSARPRRRSQDPCRQRVAPDCLYRVSEAVPIAADIGDEAQPFISSAHFKVVSVKEQQEVLADMSDDPTKVAGLILKAQGKFVVVRFQLRNNSSGSILLMRFLTKPRLMRTGAGIESGLHLRDATNALNVFDFAPMSQMHLVLQAGLYVRSRQVLDNFLFFDVPSDTTPGILQIDSIGARIDLN